MNWLKIFGLSLVLFSTSTWSQESDSWDWKVTPYLWMVNLEGGLDIGPLGQDIDMSFSDILSDLDIGGSIYTEFGKGKHALHFDFTYLRVEPDPTDLPNPPFPPSAELSSKLTAKIFEPAYNYRWAGSDGPALVLGARMTDMSLRMNPANLPSVTSGPSWWDYFVGIKTYNEISTNWDFDFYGTIGAGASDMPWTLQAMFGRRYANDNRLTLGARVWGIDYSEGKDLNRTSLDLTYYGFVIGYEFN